MPTPSYKFYTDTGLTTESTGSLDFTAIPGVTVNVDKQRFFGSIVASRKIEALSNPGVDQLIFSLDDTDLGAGVSLSDFVVATTQIGLDSASVQSLNMGTVINSLAANSVEMWIRFIVPVGFSGNDPNLAMEFVNIVETDLS